MRSNLKAIVVDDEQITRRGLIDYIQWDKLGVEIVGEASDGVEGLKLVEDTRPDLILCDIRMPRMDGIAMAQKVKELLPGCKIIFLSAYSDVQYLKSAIQLKAVDYIEKPVNLNELTELIKRTVIIWEEEKQKETRDREMMVKLEQSIPYLKYKLLANLLENEEEDSDKIKVATELIGVELPVQGRFLCCVLSTPDKEALEKIHQRSIATYEVGKVEFISGEIRQLLVFVFHIEGNMGISKIISMSQDIIASVKAELRVNTAIGISGMSIGISSIREIYRQALEAVKYYFFKGINNVILYRDISMLVKKGLILDKRKLSNMEKYIMERDFKSSIKLLDSIVKDMENEDSQNIENIKQELFRIYLIVSKIYSDRVLQLESSELWVRIFASGDIFSIRNFIVNSVMSIDESIKSSRTNKDNFEIKEVEAYIKSNFNKDISISDIANEVYLAPTYLCALFKKEMGETINDYITKIRIQNAMWLLKDRKLKLYEISLKVGYDDPNYFAKVFKKITGYNPSEYRDTL